MRAANMPGGAQGKWGARAGRIAQRLNALHAAVAVVVATIVVVVVAAVAQHALVNYTLICCVKCLFNGSRCRHVFHTFIHSSRSTCGAQKCSLSLYLISLPLTHSKCRPLFSMQQHFV